MQETYTIRLTSVNISSSAARTLAKKIKQQSNPFLTVLSTRESDIISSSSEPAENKNNHVVSTQYDQQNGQYAAAQPQVSLCKITVHVMIALARDETAR